MDILIKNMEMPKSCYSEVYSENGFCPFHCFDYHGGSHCTISACKCFKTRRPKDCPLIPVPEHGDLIDRDALLDSEKMFFAEKYHGDHRTNYDTMMGYEIGNMLRDAPVVLERTT